MNGYDVLFNEARKHVEPSRAAALASLVALLAADVDYRGVMKAIEADGPRCPFEVAQKLAMMHCLARAA